MENTNNNMNIDRKNKRKMETNEDQQEEQREQEEENEEEKMEQFFSLIRNTREMRDRLRSSSGLHVQEENKKMEAEKAVATAAAWNPTFQPEDFMENINDIEKYKKSFLHGNDQKQQAAGSSSKGKSDEEAEAEAAGKKDDKNELDLNLSL